jgi:hypothetical protein
MKKRARRATSVCGGRRRHRKVVADLVERKNAAPEGSAEYLLSKRALAGLRYSREEAGPIMEDLDPLEREATSSNPRVNESEGPGAPQRRPRLAI